MEPDLRLDLSTSFSASFEQLFIFLATFSLAIFPASSNVLICSFFVFISPFEGFIGIKERNNVYSIGKEPVLGDGEALCNITSSTLGGWLRHLSKHYCLDFTCTPLQMKNSLV